jgi:hypothetical protein
MTWASVAVERVFDGLGEWVVHCSYRSFPISELVYQSEQARFGLGSC